MLFNLVNLEIMLITFWRIGVSLRGRNIWQIALPQYFLNRVAKEKC